MLNTTPDATSFYTQNFDMYLSKRRSLKKYNSNTIFLVSFSITKLPLSAQIFDCPHIFFLFSWFLEWGSKQSLNSIFIGLFIASFKILKCLLSLTWVSPAGSSGFLQADVVYETHSVGAGDARRPTPWRSAVLDGGRKQGEGRCFCSACAVSPDSFLTRITGCMFLSEFQKSIPA